MKIELYTFNNEVWYRDEDGSKRLSVGSDIISVIYEKIADFYPAALSALEKEYRQIEDIHYKRFRIVQRFCKCNFGNIDNVFDIQSDGRFKFECVSCPLRGECKLENIVCNPKFDSKISDAEMRVLSLIYRGVDKETIADKLCLSAHTVNNHIRNAYTRIGIHSTAEFIEYASSNKLFDDERL